MTFIIKLLHVRLQVTYKWIYVKEHTHDFLAPEFRLFMDFEHSDGSITAWELLCIELVDYVCTRAYMQFDLI